MKQLLLFFLIVNFFLLSVSSYASHNRAGVITYKWLQGNKYEFTIFTCTKESSPADRPVIEVIWGDDTSDTLFRNNGPLDPNGIPSGEIIGNDTKYNVYIGDHTFPGPGIYVISFEDPNRNKEVVNMPDPFNTPFCIKTVLMINPCIVPNNSPLLLDTCIINDACVDQTYILNPNAYDPDGDSLAYKLIICKGEYCDSISPLDNILGYRFPDEIPYGCTASQNGVISLNPITGDMIWNTPQCPGQYNIAILIEEWRKDTCTNTTLKIGTIIRDMQFNVVSPCSNNPPVINNIDDICVEAGDTINFTVTATDIPDSNGVDDITLTASGEPLILSNDSAIFTPPLTPSSPVSGEFYWETVCSHIRTQPYQVRFRAEDDDSLVQLVDIETVQITIVGPAPDNLQAAPLGNTIQLNWDQSICNEVTGYKIYRRNGPYSGIIQCPCETGVPAFTGYSLIGTTNGLTATAFTDNNNGSGLIHGVQYCYRVVALFPDGAESCASVEVCAELIKDVPVITHVSVGITDINFGVDTVIWSMPTEMDTAAFPGPYHYKIYRSADSYSAATLIDSTLTDSVLAFTDTIFIDSMINTKSTPHSYKIELYSKNNLAGPTHIASSIFLSSTPADNQLTLTWQENVPWTNTQYVIYRSDSTTPLLFDSIGTSASPTYTDIGLVNAAFYCYYVKSIGAYSAPGIINPIINYSQIVCAEPVDLTPPCPPQLFVNDPCDPENNSSPCDENNYKNELKWTNPNNSCADDVVKYYIYYAPNDFSELILIDSTSPSTNTTYIHDKLFNSVAGCYAVKAVDSLIIYSFGPNQNQSAFSDTVCVDNCPVYELPNVFSPDESGINDEFIPCGCKDCGCPTLKYCFVESIDIKIYNRWGQLMFETTDPDIRWDGKNQDNNKDCTEGVYFYICYVNEIHLSGIETRVLKGFIHIFRNKKPSID